MALSDDAKGLYRELGVVRPTLATVVAPAAASSAARANEAIRHPAGTWEIGYNGSMLSLAIDYKWFIFFVINIFFAILLIGLAYEWKTGSLESTEGSAGASTLTTSSMAMRAAPSAVGSRRPSRILTISLRWVASMRSRRNPGFCLSWCTKLTILRMCWSDITTSLTVPSYKS